MMKSRHAVRYRFNHYPASWVGDISGRNRVYVSEDTFGQQRVPDIHFVVFAGVAELNRTVLM
jgi:hypothetical protein